MLKELTVKNFKSYNNETIFSMEADINRVSEYPNHIVHICDNNILRVGSIYGPNGGGKSNLLDALRLLGVMFRSGNDFSQTAELKCAFSNSSETEFSVFFVDENYEIGYNAKFKTHLDERIISFDEKPITWYSQVIDFTEENLIYREKGKDSFTSLLTRDKTGLVESELLEKEQIKLPRISQSMSAIRKLYEDYGNNEYNTSKYLDIINRLIKEVFSIQELDDTMRFMTVGMPDARIDFISKNKKDLVSLLNNVDIKIKDIKLLKKGEMVEKTNKDRIFFVRSIFKGNKEIVTELPLSSESSGTRKIFWILLDLLETRSKGVIYYADDLNAYLHPKLSRAIVEIMNSDDCTSQLIFNSHDIINMSNELFRRDEIWFAYRDENYSSVLVPLSNIVNHKGKQVRNDAIYSKQYLEGKYGADPFIMKGLHWNE